MSKKQGFTQLFIVIIIAAGMLVFTVLAVGESDSAARLQPIRLETAADVPDELTRAIKQVNIDSDLAEGLVSKIDSHVVKVLPFIDASGAKLQTK